MGGRFDLLNSVTSRISKLFPQAEAYVVQLTAGAHQQKKQLPCYTVLVHSPNHRHAVPTSVELLRSRAKSSEQTRLRCLTRSCPLRSEGEIPLQDQPANPEEAGQ